MCCPDGRDDGSDTVVTGPARPAADGSTTGPLHRTSLETPLMTHEHEHDTVVVDEDRGTGMGAMLGVIAIIVLLAAVWFFALGPGAGNTTYNNTTNNNNGGGNTPAQTQPAAPASS
jgi:hypothetical protein